jgi:hypothetical protein
MVARCPSTWPICGIRPTSSMAEQLTLNQWVQGSSPWSVTRKYPHRRGCFCLLAVRVEILRAVIQGCASYPSTGISMPTRLLSLRCQPAVSSFGSMSSFLVVGSLILYKSHPAYWTKRSLAIPIWLLYLVSFEIAFKTSDPGKANINPLLEISPGRGDQNLSRGEVRRLVRQCPIL